MASFKKSISYTAHISRKIITMHLKFLKSAISSCEPSLWNNNPPSFYEINKFFGTL